MNTIPSSLPALASDNIDLWAINPAQLSIDSVSALRSLLTPDESKQLLQYKNQAAQHTYLITRSICRLILTQYVNSEPHSLSFVRDQHGKPELVHNKHNIRFNLSHNNQVIIMVVCVNDDIGCDIEDPKRKVSIEPITRRYFSKQEHIDIAHLKGEQQQQRFFQFWTLKEAFVKATGRGISLGLDTFQFQLTTGEYDKISPTFNEHYPLNKKNQWQCYQAPFQEQLLAICRASKRQQNINYLNAASLIK